MAKKRKFADGGDVSTKHRYTGEPCGVENDCNPDSIFSPEHQAKLRELQKGLDAKAAAQKPTDKAKVTKPKGMKKGGAVKHRGDGIAKRGLTKGRIV